MQHSLFKNMYSRSALQLKAIGKPTPKRPYSTNSIIINNNVSQIKLERTGTSLEGFKRKYEEPLLDTYAGVIQEKSKSLKKILNKDARKNLDSKKWQKFDEAEVDKDLVDTHEIRIKDDYNNYLKEKKENPSNFLDFMLGRHPGAKDITSNKQILETIPPRFYALDYEAVDSNRSVSLGEYFSNEAPEKLKQTGRQWEFEKGLSKSQLLKSITTDLLEHGLFINEDNRVVEGSLSSILQSNFEKGLGDDYFPVGMHSCFPI